MSSANVRFKFQFMAKPKFILIHVNMFRFTTHWPPRRGTAAANIASATSYQGKDYVRLSSPREFDPKVNQEEGVKLN